MNRARSFMHADVFGQASASSPWCWSGHCGTPSGPGEGVTVTSVYSGPRSRTAVRARFVACFLDLSKQAAAITTRHASGTDPRSAIAYSTP